MIKTLLLDLDDTLLQNDMQTFLPPYLSGLGEYLSDLVPAERLIAALLDGTQAMLRNRDPNCTLQEVFMARFFALLDLPQDLILPRIDTFYDQIFPALKSLTSPVPGAQRLVELALERDMEVVIATNPLFPHQAIEQRLTWAGLSPKEFPFSLITSFECFHFSKPHMEYFSEILGVLGRAPDEAAMIGNDPDDDLFPARRLGLATFAVSPHPVDGLPFGPLHQAVEWLERAGDQVALLALNQPDSILARMRGNLAALNQVCGAMAPEIWNQRPSETEWAPVEIICHLRDVEREVSMDRVDRILSQTEPFLSAVDPDRWADQRGYLVCDGPKALAELNQIRLNDLQQLGQLDESDWHRPARHAILGPTNLAEVLAVANQHETLHMRQLRRTIPACRSLTHIER